MLFFENIAQRLSKIAAYLSGIILIYMISHILFEIVLRFFFSKSTHVLDEFIGYATASIMFLCLAYSLNEKALIRVGLLINGLTGKIRLAFELFSVLVTIILTSLFIYYFSTKIFWYHFTSGRVSESIAEVPLWIPESLTLVGVSVLWLQLVVLLFVLISRGMPVESESAKPLTGH